ncbi:MAG: MFS transporter [Calothrix sp. C42_A2020_038]|nr:MFS transporter [Calothrix sp. C42_A2020_038]
MIEMRKESQTQGLLTIVREMRIFILIWFGQIVSVTGSGLTNFALDIWVLQKTDSVTQFAILILCSTLPFVLISPLSGVLTDRFSRRWLMIISDFCAGLCTLSMALLYANGKLEIWHLYLATASSNALLGIQWPSYNASTTLLVPQKHLGRANGMNQLADGFSRLVAPILAAFLLGTIHLNGIIIIDFSTMLFALVPLLLLPFPELSNVVQTSEETTKSDSFWVELSQGWIYLKERPGLLGVVLLSGMINFLVGVFDVTAIPLGLTLTSVIVTGSVFSIACSGLVISGVAMSIWGEVRRYTNILFVGIFFAGIFLIVAGLRPSLFLFTPASFFFFLTVPAINTSIFSILQKKVVPEVQGRIFALQGAVASICLPLGYVVAGSFADIIFEPLMAPDGALANSVGKIIGTGEGRGLGLLLILVGGIAIFLTSIAYLYPRLQLVEEELPDVITNENSSIPV